MSAPGTRLASVMSPESRWISRRRSFRLDPTKEFWHAVKLVDVVRSGVAREPEYLEATLSGLAQLLHAPRTPREHGRSAQPKRSHEIVGRLRRARERPGEDLRVRDEEALLVAHGCLSKRDELGELGLVERPALLDDRALGYVARVQSIEQDHGVDRRKMASIPQDRSNGPVSSAESNENHALERDGAADRGRRLTGDAREQRIVHGRIAERSVVHAGARGKAHGGGDIPLSQPRRRHLRNERGAVKVDHEPKRALALSA